MKETVRDFTMDEYFDFLDDMETAYETMERLSRGQS